MAEQQNTYTGQLFSRNKVWIFQAVPIYDVLGALNDPDIGDKIHWQVNQYEKFIKKGDIVLIWLSGPKAGMYALAEVLTKSFAHTRDGSRKEILDRRHERKGKKCNQNRSYVED